MAKRVVLIRCNYPGTKAELKGCINDVKRMHRCLTERYDFSDEDITVLIDTDDFSAEPGDLLFIHYSGHDTRLPAKTVDKIPDQLCR